MEDSAHQVLWPVQEALQKKDELLVPFFKVCRATTEWFAVYGCTFVLSGGKLAESCGHWAISCLTLNAQPLVLIG